MAFLILTRFPLFLTLLKGLSILSMSSARALVFAQSVLIVQHGQACVLHSLRSLLYFLGDLLQIFHCFLQPKILQALVKDLAAMKRLKAKSNYLFQLLQHTTAEIYIFYSITTTTSTSKSVGKRKEN